MALAWTFATMTLSCPRKEINKKRLSQGLNRLTTDQWGENLDELLSSTKLPNYYFENNGDLTFSAKAKEYGLAQPGFSNGAAYADLDNDGDLDLIVNNINETAHIYRNNASGKGYNAIRIRLIGQGSNTFGLGAKVVLKTGGETQYQELTLTRGFQSSVEPTLHFGLGKSTTVDEIRVKWPDGRIQVMNNIQSNRMVVFKQQDAVSGKPHKEPKTPHLFADATRLAGVYFRHKENEYDDFEKEILLPHKMSQFGPQIAVGDANGDGLDDFYVGGASGQAGALYFGNGKGFSAAPPGPWVADKVCEDLGSLFFDADGDGDADLYVVSGGNEFPFNAPQLMDRLYINQGKGRFVKSKNKLPRVFTSGSCVAAADVDGDQDLDLFVGGRLVPGSYPFPARSYLLQNNHGVFRDVTEQMAPDLMQPGMVTDALWSDVDNDGQADLVVTGEWMSIGIYKNNNGALSKLEGTNGLQFTNGWWNRLATGDFDNDGDMDFIAGNLGLNYKYKATSEKPFNVYCHDFDMNGSLDIVLGYYNENVCYPVRGRQCTSQQMPMIKDRFPTYNEFARASIDKVYGQDLKKALHHEAHMFASSYIENLGSNRFVVHPLPTESQFSTIFGIVPFDYNRDGHLDILVAGNFYASEVETGRADASIGLYLQGDGKGNFKPVHMRESGFYAPNDVRHLALVKTSGGQPMILVANNDDKMQVFKVLLPRATASDTKNKAGKKLARK